jgi:hypothetical protein
MEGSERREGRMNTQHQGKEHHAKIQEEVVMKVIRRERIQSVG